MKRLGGATTAIFGVAALPGMPIASAAATRRASSRATSASSPSIAAGVSVPVIPRSLARTKTIGFVASTIEASTPARVSRARPVGRRRPVRAPPGSRKSSAMRAPSPATPGSSKSPTTAASPSTTGTRATMIFRVLVLWMRTAVSPLAEGTSRSSIAKGPTAEEQLPQLPV